MLTELELRVQPINQHDLHPTTPDEENNACWYAASLMVLSYRGVLPTLALNNPHSSQRKAKNQGIFPYEFWHLANEAGLEHANASAVLPQREAANWRTALDTLGPLIVSVGAHIVVVTGVVRRGLDWHIVFNDPLPGARRTMVITRFNYIMSMSMPVLYRRSFHRPPVAQMAPVARPLG